MKPPKIELKGAVDTKGAVTGEGSLTFGISDAAKAGMSFDYVSSERVRINLQSSVGFKIRKSQTLMFTGAISKDLKTRLVDGKATVQLEVPKHVAVTLQQSFKKKGSKTSLSVTVRF